MERITLKYLKISFGGEFETFVLNCPLFSKELKIKDKQIHGKNNSWKMEIEIT